LGLSFENSETNFPWYWKPKPTLPQNFLNLVLVFPNALFAKDFYLLSFQILSNFDWILSLEISNVDIKLGSFDRLKNVEINVFIKTLLG
jgi:hypothetical protein